MFQHAQVVREADAGLVDARVAEELGEDRKASVRRSWKRYTARAVAICTKLGIPKGAQTSSWSVPHLSEKQIAYAAADAWACRELYLKFRSLGLL